MAIEFRFKSLPIVRLRGLFEGTELHLVNTLRARDLFYNCNAIFNGFLHEPDHFWTFDLTFLIVMTYRNTDERR